MDGRSRHAGARDLAAFARLLADDTRADFCLTLLDGRAWTAAELARHAGVAASTASSHLDLLVSGGLLAQERRGRHRYVRLADHDAAQLVEALASAAPQRAAVPRTLRAATQHEALARARICYDHLAGALGVTITETMTDRGLLDWSGGLRLTSSGAAWLDELGITLPPGSRRPVVRSCIDWTQRRPHLAGAAAAAMCAHAFGAGWITRLGSGRAVELTDAGRAAFRSKLGLPDGAL